MEVNRIIQGHALDVLKGLPDKLVDCVITSPPYWSLRDYKTEPVIWGGYKDCRHSWGKILPKHHPGHVQQTIHVNTEGAEKGQTAGAGQFCSACNAWRGQLGLEPSIELYLDHLLSIFDEVGRVMKDEATLWVNLGDSYSGSKKGIGRTGDGKEVFSDEDIQKTDWSKSKVLGKSLCLIPQRFAIAMVDRGWILRNTVIWHKPNCMPSSAKDRFTVDFEPVYFFVKKGSYYFEQQYEPQADTEYTRARYKYAPSPGQKLSRNEDTNFKNDDFAKYFVIPEGRNMRAVWTIPSAAYSEAHFATFPPKLVEPMVLAGCPELVCLKCGKGRERIIENQYDEGRYDRGEKSDNFGFRQDVNRRIIDKGLTDCGCGASWGPGLVLDPFIGSGTVAFVAAQNRRNYLGIDLSGEYNEMSDKRIFDPNNSQIKLF